MLINTKCLIEQNLENRIQNLLGIIHATSDTLKAYPTNRSPCVRVKERNVEHSGNINPLFDVKKKCFAINSWFSLAGIIQLSPLYEWNKNLTSCVVRIFCIPSLVATRIQAYVDILSANLMHTSDYSEIYPGRSRAKNWSAQAYSVVLSKVIQLTDGVAQRLPRQFRKCALA